MTSTSETPDTTSIPETSATTNDVPAFGWSGYAERVNGRFAMVGFVADVSGTDVVSGVSLVEVIRPVQERPKS